MWRKNLATNCLMGSTRQPAAADASNVSFTTVVPYNDFRAIAFQNKFSLSFTRCQASQSWRMAFIVTSAVSSSRSFANLPG